HIYTRYLSSYCTLFFFFNHTATTDIYTLSLHDALPISSSPVNRAEALRPVSTPQNRSLAISPVPCASHRAWDTPCLQPEDTLSRSEEHTSELQSPCNLVCRLLLEKKKNKIKN